MAPHTCSETAREGRVCCHGMSSTPEVLVTYRRGTNSPEMSRTFGLDLGSDGDV